jgi:hypothetical protein
MSDDKILGGAIILAIVIGLASVSWMKRLWSKQEVEEQNKVVKKEENVQPEQEKPKRKWIIPVYEIEEVYRMWDSIPDGDASLPTYLFWKKIETLFPETKDFNLTFNDESIFASTYRRN